MLWMLLSMNLHGVDVALNELEWHNLGLALNELLWMFLSMNLHAVDVALNEFEWCGCFFKTPNRNQFERAVLDEFE